MGKKNGLFFILFLAAAFAAPAWGQGSQAGLVYGLSVPDAENTNPYMLTGIKGSARLTPYFSTGGYYMTSDKQGAPSSTDKFRYSIAGVEAVYHIVQGQGDTYFGVRAGITKIKTSPNGEDATFSPYHYGIATGYDYLIYPWLAVGFEGSYLHAERGKTIQNGATIQLDSFNIMSFLASIQIRL
jgi:hypothetical protein